MTPRPRPPAVPPEPIQLTSGATSAQAKAEPPVPALPADRKEPAARHRPGRRPPHRHRPSPRLPAPSRPRSPRPSCRRRPGAGLAPTELDSAELPPLSSEAGVPTGAPAPLPDLAPRVEERPNLPDARPEAPAPGPSTPIAVPGPETESLPPLPDMAAPAPVEPPPAPSADSFPVPRPRAGPGRGRSAAVARGNLPESGPGARCGGLAAVARDRDPARASGPRRSGPLPRPRPRTRSPLPVESSPGPAPETSSRPAPRDLQDPPTTLSPELQREVDRIARQQDEEDMTRNRDAVRPAPGEAPVSDAPGMPDTSATRLELPRPPSPTEARPLRAIPVPEEFVPLAPRDWAPNRKVWAAAGVCHKPLYFQDAALERYGQTAEQYVGPLGRYLSYPLDDPTQSNQRNQIAQPFFSIGPVRRPDRAAPLQHARRSPLGGRVRPGLLPPR